MVSYKLKGKLLASLIVLAFTIPFLMTSAQGAFIGFSGAWGLTNDTGEDFDHNITLLDVDWEKETVGSTPDIYHNSYYYTNENRSGSSRYMFEVVSAAPYGKALNINQTGRATGYYAGGFAIGHFLSGKFSFSFDAYPHMYTYGGVPYVRISLSDAENFNNDVLSHTFQDDMTTSGSKTLSYPLGMNDWYHIVYDVDFPAKTWKMYLDGVNMDNGTINAAYDAPGFVKFTVASATHDLTIMDYTFDNIKITVPGNTIQPIGDIEDNRTAFSICFDGAYLDTYNNTSAMHGFPAQIDPVTSWIGVKSANMNWSQIQELVDAGWEVGTHGVSMLHHPVLTDEQIIAEYVNSVRSIEENLTGVDVKTFSWPFDDWNIHDAQLSWDYFEYSGTRGYLYDLDRRYLFAVNASDYNTHVLCKWLPATLYGYYGFMQGYTHKITDNPGSYDTHIDALDFLMGKMRQNNSRVTTPSEAFVAARNFAAVNVVGNAEAFSTSYDSVNGNFTNGTVWIRGPDGVIYSNQLQSYVLNTGTTYNQVVTGDHFAAMTVNTSSSRMDINVISYTPKMQDSMAFNISSSGYSECTFTILGLRENVSYDVFIDGSISLASKMSDANGTLVIEYAGSGAHAIIVSENAINSVLGLIMIILPLMVIVSAVAAIGAGRKG